MFRRKPKKKDPRKLWEQYLEASLKRDWNKARESLASLVALEPDNSRMHLKMGDLLQKMGDSTGAIASYYHSAAILDDAGFGQKALALYKIILRLDKDDKKASSKSKSIIEGLEPAGPGLPIVSPDEQPSQPEEAPAPEEAPPPAHWPSLDEAQASEQIPSLSDVTGEDFSSAPPESQPEEILPELDIVSHDPPEITGWSGPLPEIFWSLNKEEIDQIVSASIATSYTKGQAVVREGEEGDSIFVLINGNARVEARFGNRNIELATLKGGDVFGEVAFLSGKRRTASVIAESDIKVLDIHRNVLEQAIEKHPRILSCLAEYYHNRVQATLKKLRPKKPKGRLIIRD